jgi:hypothetical protein
MSGEEDDVFLQPKGAQPTKVMEITPPKFNVSFHNSRGEMIGKLEFDEAEETMKFEGNAERSAEVFFEHFIRDNFQPWYEEKFGDKKHRG